MTALALLACLTLLLSGAPRPASATPRPQAPVRLRRTGEPSPSNGASRPPQADPGLPEAFRSQPWSARSAEWLAAASGAVAGQLAILPDPAPFEARLARAAERVQFLVPFAYLVRAAYSSEPELRDELLELYRRDPQAAIHRLDELGLWPGGTGEALLASRAYYDPDEDRVLVNLGATREAQAFAVLVHELWHALPEPRVLLRDDGSRVRVTGFLLLRWDAHFQAWVPDEERRDPVVTSATLHEAMVFRLEWQVVGAEPATNAPVRAAAVLLDRLEASASGGGRARLLALYLASDLDGLYRALDALRAEPGK